jgi:sigma-B regulation protein RsbU (phosphoserine phosphatase)
MVQVPSSSAFDRRDETQSDIALKTITALGTESSEALHASTHLDDLLRTASRHCKRLVGAETVRIWISRRGGQRLVARQLTAGSTNPPVEYRVARGEGLAGWAVDHEQSLRLAAADPRPELRGAVPTFRSALVMPLFRRGRPFGAIECLDKQGGEGFTDADFDNLETASEHIALALDNALLYQQAERRSLEKEVLLDLSRAISTPLDLDGVIEAIFKSLHQVVDFDAGALYLVNRKTLALEMVREVGYPQNCEQACQLQVGQGIVGWVAKTGEAVIVPDVKNDPRYVAVRTDTRSELAAPLILNSKTIGVFNLESDLDDAYHEGHLDIVRAFASQAAVAVERARVTRELLERRHLEKELTIAREIQLSFLPKTAPEIANFDIAGTSRPHDQVGGDYYDFIHVSETRLGIAIADVAGKGIPAALLMAGFRMSLLAEIRNEFAIRAVMRKVNGLVYESTDRNKFVTAFYSVLDTKNRALIFSNAGHNPPMLFRREGAIEYLVEGGVALGVLPDALYEDRPVALRPGDVLVLYTDGISEAESPSREQFGPRRIEQTVTRLADRSSREILEGLVEDVLAWSGARGPNDDITLVVLKARPDEPEAGSVASKGRV